MFASSRQRSTPSGSLTGEEVKNTQQGGDLEASETEVNRYTPPAQEGHQTPGHSTHARLRSRTSSDTTIPPPPAPRMFSHGVCAPTSDAGLSHAVTYNDHHDTGSGSHPETAKASAFTASPLVSERQRFLCCSSISPGSRSARGSTRGSACFRSAFQLAKWISLAVVLGALFVDVYLLKEAIFMEDSGVDIAPTSESAGPSQVGAVHRQRSPRPRLPLPLVVAHHVFTNRGLPAEENTYTADRAAVVRQSGYTVDTDNNVGDNPINNNAGDTEPPSSPLSQQAARVPSSEKHSATTKLRMGEPRMNTKQNIVDDYWQEQDTNQAVNNKQNWRDQRQEPGQPDMIMANDKTAIFAGHEQPTLAPETVSEMYGGQRVAVVVPYIGNDLPVWWDVFAEQARHNEGLVDWIIFCDQKLVRKGGPSNIKFFPMSSRRIAWILAGVVVERHIDEYHDHDTREKPSSSGKTLNRQTRRRLEDKQSDTSRPHEVPVAAAGKEGGSDIEQKGTHDDMTSAIAARQLATTFLDQLLVMSPYYLVEFKPALGWLFREYLKNYSHWAFGDLDVLFGDMRRGWLEPNELRDFDIITFSFGDQYRAYLRGQLTIHKNKPKVNRTWRGCPHLMNYAERLEKFRQNRALPLESAEGCYSLAAATDKSLKIKFSVKALSDVDEEGETTSNRDGQVIVDGKGLVSQCPHLGYYYDRHSVSDAGVVRFDAPSGLSSSIQDMQDPVGPISTVRRFDAGDSRCEHWIKQEYQTCVEGVTKSDTLFLIGGEYLKQAFVNTKAASGGRQGCRAGAFYHFQDHKVNYRGWNTQPPVPSIHYGIAAGPAGLVPLPADGWKERALNLAPPVVPALDKHVHSYCLEWMERRRPRRPHKGRPELICTERVSGSEAVTLADTRTIRPRSAADRRSGAAPLAAITLGGVGPPADVDLFLANAQDWDGPKIYAMVLNPEEIAITTKVLGMEDVVGPDTFIVALVRPEAPAGERRRSPQNVPRKALMNLVSDLCETRYLFILPGPVLLGQNAYEGIKNRLTDATSQPPVRQSPLPGPVTLVIPVSPSRPPVAEDTIASPTISGVLAAANHVLPAAGISTPAAPHQPRRASKSLPAIGNANVASGGIDSTAVSASGRASKAVADNARTAVAAAEAAEAAAVTAAEAAAGVKARVAEATAVIERTEEMLRRAEAAHKAAEMQAMVQATAQSLMVETVKPDSAKPPGSDSVKHAEQQPSATVHRGGKDPGEAVAPSHGAHESKSAKKSSQVNPHPPTEASTSKVIEGKGGHHDHEKNVDQGHHQEKTLKPEESETQHKVSTSAQPRPRSGDVKSQQKSRNYRRRLKSASNSGSTTGRPTRDGWDDEGQEEKWLRTLLLSAANMAGLVVDMWSPGAQFLRQVEEFGEAGCLDGTYALGLWHAGSSFHVVYNVAMTPTGAMLASRGADRARSDEESERGDSGASPNDDGEGDTCLPGPGTIKTAAIYSAFLRQVADVYRHPRAGDIDDETDRVSPDDIHGKEPITQRSNSPAQGSSDERSKDERETERTTGGAGASGGGVGGLGIILGGRPAIARQPFVFPSGDDLDTLGPDGDEDDVLPEIGGGRAKKGGWGGAWEDYMAGP